jgi:hypothetical protein
MTILHFQRSVILTGSLFRTTRLRRCRLEECHGACCLHGVWVDPLEKEDILRHAGAFLPHMAEERRDPNRWFGDTWEEDAAFPSGRVVPSAVIANPAHYGGTECVFLRPDWLCALQVAAVSAGEHRWRWKPFHCIIHPIATENGEFTLASDEELLAEDGGCFRSAPQESRMNDWLAEEIDFLIAGIGAGSAAETGGG